MQKHNSNNVKTVTVHRVLVTRDQDGLFEINYSFMCPHCGKEHTQREADGPYEIFDLVSYSLRCGGVLIVMPWYKGNGGDASIPDYRVSHVAV